MAERALPYLALAATLLLGACGEEHMNAPEVHGHRGCRGLMPENTIPAFAKALELGCTWLELDVVLTGDGEVLVSHEPWMDHRICRTSNGDSIAPGIERSFNIYRMGLAEVQAFDCGSAEHPDFPEQEHQRLHKPTLREVVEAMDDLAAESGLGAVSFNIEIKSEPELYGTFQPEPPAFAKAVVAVIDELHLDDRCIVQSFDPAVLEAVRAIDPALRLSLLVENTDGIDANLKRLSFTPAFYSPAFEQVDKAAVDKLHALDIEVAVWTVNEVADMQRMAALGVDAIITDFPDRALRVVEELE